MAFKRCFGVMALILSLTSFAQAQTGVLKNTTLDVDEETSVIRLDGVQSLGISVVNSGTYELRFEASADGGVTYVAVGAVDVSDFTRDSSTTGAGTWLFGNQGFTHFRVRVESYSSGAPVVKFARGYGSVTAPLSAGSVSGANDAASATGAAVPASGSYTGINVAGTLRGWTGISLGSHYAGTVAIVDGSGAHITSFGGGTQYAEGATAATITGTAMMMEGAANALVPAQGTAADGLLVNLGANNDITGTLAGSLTHNNAAAAGNRLATLPAIVQNSAPTLTDGRDAALSITTGGAARVILSDAAGAALPVAADVIEDAAETAGGTGPMVLSVRRDTLASSAGSTGDNATFNSNERGALYTQPTGGANGGADGLSYISAGSTEDEHAVKATAGTLYSITVTNTNAAVRYLKCENDTAANTAPGTDTPEFRMAIPGATTGGGFTTSFPVGWSFSTALTCWIVTGAADSDVAEVAANEIMVFYSYR